MTHDRKQIRAILQTLRTDRAEQVTLEADTFGKLAEAYLSYDRDDLMRAQMALREETRQLELSEKIAGVGHWYWQVGSNQIAWSEQIFRIHGMEFDDNHVSLEQALDCYHRDDREKAKDYLYQAIKDRSGFEFELRLVRADGAVRDVLSRGLPEFDAEGQVVGLFGIFQDITERKNHERLQANLRKILQEEVQRRTRELRLVNQELKDYTYIVSHDLRAPLLSIIGHAKDLEANTAEQLSALSPLLASLEPSIRQPLVQWHQEELPESLAYIRKNAQRMDSLISSLLELARLGQRVPRIQTVDLAQLTSAILEGLAYQIEQKQIEFQVGQFPLVEADRFYLETIMRNLLSNAVKYTPAGTQGRIAVDCCCEGDCVTVSVSDTGRGIAADDLHKIFLPFRRVGDLDSEGEGMGLAYVQLAVSQCGGVMEVRSELGKGATFQFTIPRSPGLSLRKPVKVRPDE